jgi:hypothetical protein
VEDSGALRPGEDRTTGGSRTADRLDQWPPSGRRHGFQAVTSIRNASDLFACKWLRAPDLNQQCWEAIATWPGIESRVSVPFLGDTSLGLVSKRIVQQKLKNE